MGAASSLLYMKENPGSADCVVMDSGFADLKSVISSMGGQMGIPPEFVEMLYPMLCQGVSQSVPGFNIDEMRPEDAAKSCEAPAHFLHG